MLYIPPDKFFFSLITEYHITEKNSIMLCQYVQIYVKMSVSRAMPDDEGKSGYACIKPDFPLLDDSAKHGHRENL